jgi:hypothetical protein
MVGLNESTEGGARLSNAPLLSPNQRIVCLGAFHPVSPPGVLMKFPLPYLLKHQKVWSTSFLQVAGLLESVVTRNQVQGGFPDYTPRPSNGIADSDWKKLQSPKRKASGRRP